GRADQAVLCCELEGSSRPGGIALDDGHLAVLNEPPETVPACQLVHLYLAGSEQHLTSDRSRQLREVADHLDRVAERFGDGQDDLQRRCVGTKPPTDVHRPELIRPGLAVHPHERFGPRTAHADVLDLADEDLPIAADVAGGQPHLLEALRNRLPAGRAEPVKGDLGIGAHGVRRLIDTELNLHRRLSLVARWESIEGADLVAATDLQLVDAPKVVHQISCLSLLAMPRLVTVAGSPSRYSRPSPRFRPASRSTPGCSARPSAIGPSSSCRSTQ